MKLISASLLLFTILIGLSQIALALHVWQYFYNYRRSAKYQTKDFTPSVALICPCKGLENKFEENIHSMLQLDYKNYNIIFVVSSSEDPAYAVLKRLISNFSHAQLILSKPSQKCGDKLNNLLAAVETDIARRAEVLAFVDSDGKPHPYWLKSLVTPLSEPDVGLTTSYRWYQPISLNFWSWMRAVGNNVAMTPYMINPKIAWGGAMAVRQEDFEESKIKDVWASVISDDLTLAKQINQLGKRIVFVPDCVTTTSDNCTLAEYYNWLLRQSIMIKTYNLRIWRLTFISFLPVVVMWLGFLLMLVSVVFPEVRSFGLIFLSVIPLQIIGGILTALIFKDFKTALWVPLGLVFSGSVSIWALIRSAFTKHITWRGITYEIDTPNKIIVNRPSIETIPT